MRKSLPQRQGAVTNRLWRHRKEQRLSQKQVAFLLGHKKTAQVSRWENGEKTPTLENALMLGHILKVPVEALYAELSAQLHRRIDASAARAPWNHNLSYEATTHNS